MYTYLDLFSNSRVAVIGADQQFPGDSSDSERFPHEANDAHRLRGGDGSRLSLIFR
jgi:hypothetical protein